MTGDKGSERRKCWAPGWLDSQSHLQGSGLQAARLPTSGKVSWQILVWGTLGRSKNATSSPHFPHNSSTCIYMRRAWHWQGGTPGEGECLSNGAIGVEVLLTFRRISDCFWGSIHAGGEFWRDLQREKPRREPPSSFCG